MSIDKKSLKKEYELLIRNINYHNKMYHTYDSPEISDSAYDKLYSKLKVLEKNHPNLIIPESPTMRVGSKLLDGFKKVRHQEPMLSLGNAANHEDFLNFYTRLKKDLNTNKGILTNLHIDLDYNKLKNSLPNNIQPAYDNLNFEILL